MIASGSATTRENVAEALWTGLLESVADTATLKLPALVGVPLMTPDEPVSVRPNASPAENQE